MPKKLERCVRKVKAKGGVRDPWAVCMAATGKKKHHSAEPGKFMTKRAKKFGVKL